MEATAPSLGNVLWEPQENGSRRLSKVYDNNSKKSNRRKIRKDLLLALGRSLLSKFRYYRILRHHRCKVP